MTRVGLLADRLDRNGRHTGVGAYIDGLIGGLETVAPEDPSVVAFTVGRERRFDPDGRIVRRSALPWPRRPTALLWSGIGRPRLRGVDGPLDLLHVLVPTTPVASAVPLIVTLHDLMPLKYPHLFEVRRRLLFRETIRRLRRQASWFIAVSEATKTDAVELLHLPEERVVVVHHGVPRHFARASLELQRQVREQLGLAEAQIVAFVGEVTERKNVPRLVEAFAQVRRDVPRSRLVLAGSAGVGAERVAEAIQRHGLGDAVMILGHAAQETTEAIVAAADVLVLPSLDEGFGFPALEAMHAGTAVIASTAGSLPEVVGEAGLLVSPTDVDALASAMANVLLDDRLRQDLSTRGVQRAASEFSWATAARKTLDVYGNALRT